MNDSYRVLPCPILPCPLQALPRLVLPYPALPCPPLPCPVLLCPILPYPAMPYSAMPYLPCPALPCPALSDYSSVCPRLNQRSQSGCAHWQLTEGECVLLFFRAAIWLTSWAYTK